MSFAMDRAEMREWLNQLAGHPTAYPCDKCTTVDYASLYDKASVALGEDMIPRTPTGDLSPAAMQAMSDWFARSDWTEAADFSGAFKRCEACATARPLAWMIKIDVDRCFDFVNEKLAADAPWDLHELKRFL